MFNITFVIFLKLKLNFKINEKKKIINHWGFRGNGLEILKELKIRGDYVINVSRSKNDKAHKNITLDLLDEKYLKILMTKLGKTKIDALIFTKIQGNKV